MTLWPLHQPPANVFDVVLNLAQSVGLGRHLRVNAGDSLAHESRDQDQPALLDRSVRSFSHKRMFSVVLVRSVCFSDVVPWG